MGGVVMISECDSLEGESLLAGVGVIVRSDEKRPEQLLLFGPGYCSRGSVVVVT